MLFELKKISAGLLNFLSPNLKEYFFSFVNFQNIFKTEFLFHFIFIINQDIKIKY